MSPCNRPYHMTAPCPNCVEKDEENKWKGARMGRTNWGHNYMCCSEKCGQEFLNNPKRINMDKQRIMMRICILNEQLKQLKKEK